MAHQYDTTFFVDQEQKSYIDVPIQFDELADVFFKQEEESYQPDYDHESPILPYYTYQNVDIPQESYQNYPDYGILVKNEESEHHSMNISEGKESTTTKDMDDSEKILEKHGNPIKEEDLNLEDIKKEKRAKAKAKLADKRAQKQQKYDMDGASVIQKANIVLDEEIAIKINGNQKLEDLESELKNLKSQSLSKKETQILRNRLSAQLSRDKRKFELEALKEQNLKLYLELNSCKEYIRNQEFEISQTRQELKKALCSKCIGHISNSILKIEENQEV